MSDLRFSVVISTINRPAFLRETLRSLEACAPAPDEVIVVDADPNESARALVDQFQNERLPAVSYVHTKPGLTAQRNRGIDESSGDVVVFLDDDVELEPSLFAHLHDAYADPTLVGATGRIIESEPKRLGGMRSPIRALLHPGREGTFTSFGYPRYLRHTDRERDVEFMLGCFMSARRDLAAALRFDEHMDGYALAEDEDFSYRLSRQGRIRYLPDVVVHHRKLGFSSKDSRELGRLVVANRAYLFRKNFPQTRRARAKFAILVAVLVGHRLINGELRGAQGLLEGALRLRRSGAWHSSG
jgi:GT2 family glycosyltransferase